MQTISKEILADYQVRKTVRQKKRFLDRMMREYPEAFVEEGGFFHNRNLIIGDVESADIIFSAHYDTCTALPFPNLVFPKNIPLTLLYSVLICIPMFFCTFAVGFLIRLMTDNYWINYFGVLGSFVVIFMALFFFGIPNRHTANDNTSGVVALCELMSSLSEEQKRRVAFVFFDNEENGLLGSAFFRKKHKAILKNKLLFNFDCVSDGDHMLLVLDKASKKKYGEKIKSSFTDSSRKTVWIEDAKSTYYPSDQAGFPMGLALSSMKRGKIVGLYMDRIHTVRDTVFDYDNIMWIVDGVQKFLS